MGDPVITLDHVEKHFGDVAAVRGVDLTVGRGELFSLLGPSGCGKTTLLRMIAGFDSPTSGRVLLEGVDQVGVPPHKRAVNTVFQQYALFPHMTVAQNVAFGPKSRGARGRAVEDQVAAMLSVVRMSEFAHRRPARLSGGQQQRVALARALVNLPTALLLDEPLAALDLKLRQAMQTELKRIQREVGITFVFVTHDQHEALALSDRIAVMNQGRVEQVGTPQEIYRDPASLFVAGFIGTANLLPAVVTVREPAMVQARLDDGGGLIEAPLPLAMGTDLGVGVAVGDAVTVMIRPDDLCLHNDRYAAGGCLGAPFVARVVDLTFHGASVRVGLGRRGVPLVANVAAHDAQFLRVGDDCSMTCRPGAARILAGRPPSAGATDTDVDVVEANV